MKKVLLCQLAQMIHEHVMVLEGDRNGTGCMFAASTIPDDFLFPINFLGISMNADKIFF